MILLPTALVLVVFTVTRVTLRDSNTEKIFSFNEISCEEVVQWGMNNVRTCEMNGTSSINASNVVISGPKDDEVLEIDFSGNRKIELLPALIAVKYPKLRHYSAWLCSIRKISKINFFQLTNLEWLDLSYNRIESIDDNTFHGLVSLQKVDLCKFELNFIFISKRDVDLFFAAKNKIAFMNGALFSGLPVLKLVSLEMNVCISQKFTTAYELRHLPENIDNDCSFLEQAEQKLRIKIVKGAVYMLRNY